MERRETVTALAGVSANSHNALILAPEAPYPVVGGGPLRTASLIMYFAARYTLDVIVFREPGRPDPRQAFPTGIARDIFVIDLPYHSKTPAARILRNAVRLVRGVPPLIDRFSGFDEQIAGFLKGRKYQVSLIEFFWCARYAAQLAQLSDRVILDLHNVESELHQMCAKTEFLGAAWAHRRFSRRCLEMEQQWLPEFSAILTTSEEDAFRINPISGQARVIVYPNAIPRATRCQRREEEIIAFSGNMEYHPNISAVRYFIQEIWPSLKSKWPGLRWRLIGKNSDAIREFTANDDRIDISGAVEDAVAELSAAKVVVVPLLAGSGTRLKIIEAWAAGRAVVSTSIGARGLGATDGENILIADSASSFARAVSSLLAEPAERQRLGKNGRQLYEERFTWDVAWKQLGPLI